MKKLLSIVLIVCCLLSVVGIVSACDGDDWNNGILKSSRPFFPRTTGR